ncbi:hypothetical protein [Leptospira noguchii]|uniref:Uncharacterized protein n=1 Tax=Leptospira noguchii TaxID=28182 RepID=M6VS68_9LEPT|nr:hypothetical protein [Leptospira noguchii]EMO52438.1 hypothetical protein LEP1GSC172_0362 [Leptospira noguchii]
MDLFEVNFENTLTTWTHENGTKINGGFFNDIEVIANCAKPRIVGFFERISHSKF